MKVGRGGVQLDGKKIWVKGREGRKYVTNFALPAFNKVSANKSGIEILELLQRTLNVLYFEQIEAKGKSKEKPIDLDGTGDIENDSSEDEPELSEDEGISSSDSTATSPRLASASTLVPVVSSSSPVVASSSTPAAKTLSSPVDTHMKRHPSLCNSPSVCILSE